MEILEQGVKEVSETGRLSFPVRRALWLALGPWEERDETDDNPRLLTQPLRKRAELALACARKVGKIWAVYAPEDKEPQTAYCANRSLYKGFGSRILHCCKIRGAWFTFLSHAPFPPALYPALLCLPLLDAKRNMGIIFVLIDDRFHPFCQWTFLVNIYVSFK